MPWINYANLHVAKVEFAIKFPTQKSFIIVNLNHNISLTINWTVRRTHREELKEQSGSLRRAFGSNWAGLASRSLTSTEHTLLLTFPRLISQTSSICYGVWRFSSINMAKSAYFFRKSKLTGILWTFFFFSPLIIYCFEKLLQCSNIWFLFSFFFAGNCSQKHINIHRGTEACGQKSVKKKKKS